MRSDVRVSLAGRRISLAAFGLALLAIVLLLERQARGSSRPAARTPPPAPPVVAVEARRGEIPIVLSELGSVTPLQTVTVHSRVDGELLRVHFREGQGVRAGELLAEIDPRPFEVQLAQSEGQKARDQALLENARVDLARYRDLYPKEAIPKQQLDAQEALVREYEAALATDDAQIASARLQLTYCRITAPLDGRLGLRLVDAGNIVHATDAAGLVVITQVEPIAVVFSLPEDDLPRVLARLHDGATLSAEAYDREQKARLATGSVLTVDNQIDPATGTVRVKAVFPNRDGALFPNQFVNVRLLVDTTREATIVPTAALQRGPESAFVYVVKPDHTVARREVTVGTGDGETSAVTAGVQAGDLVVVEGFDRLQDGTRVTVGGAPAGADP